MDSECRPSVCTWAEFNLVIEPHEVKEVAESVTSGL